MLVCVVERVFVIVVERLAMSIINKMHQDLNQEQPILANMPKKKGTQKVLLLFLIIILTGSSLGLAYLIFIQESMHAETEIAVVKTAQPVATQTLKKKVSSRVELQEEATAVPVKAVAQQKAAAKVKNIQVAAAKKTISKEKETAAQVVADKIVPEAPAISADKNSAAIPPPTTSVPVNEESGKSNSLEIKTAKLSKAQLAQIHLKEADKAQAEGELEVAAKKRLQALALLPTLNDVRKSLALYYYGQGNINKASRLLQTGALVSPDYADFNLMLSRIALKAGDYRKAYLYLEQHPPRVEGHLDYYVSHAILAQKFQHYEKAERLYTSLLSQRPNNGRWRMALAIAQDKQAKTERALSSYKNALLQPDLSSKAKAYIKQRLIYLEQN